MLGALRLSAQQGRALNNWVGNTVTRPKRVNLGVREFGANLEGGDLVRQTKTKD